MRPDFPFNIFEPYISDEEVTDINYNGKDLWIDHLINGRFMIEDFMLEHDVLHACQRFSNIVNQHFNLQVPILESDFNDLRISVLHPSISGRLSVSIRKTPTVMRLNEKKIIDEDYMSQDCLDYLKDAVMNHKNIMVSGLPGAGKTELVKFLTSYIETKERVISIEDSRELHYGELHPERDSVSLKVNESFTYELAIKASMRQRPNWILLSEVRGKEVEDLLKSISTGTHLLSTIHAKSAKEIPLRMLYMMENIDKSSDGFLSQLYDAIDIGVHVLRQETETRVKRFVKEVVEFKDGRAIDIYHYEKKRDIL